MRFYGNLNRLTSTEASITKTSSNSPWKPDGFPSISLGLSTFSWAVSITKLRLSTHWYPTLLLCDGKWTTCEVLGFSAAIGILRSAGPSLRFRGDRKPGIGRMTWVFGAILFDRTGELRPTLTYASASGPLTLKDPKG